MGDIVAAAAPIAGAFIGNSIAPGVGGALGAQLGGALGGSLASRQAGQTAATAAGNVAQGLQFKPFGMTNTFGTSNFGYDPTTGQLTSAGYSLSPFLQQYQSSLTSPEAATQNLSDVNATLGLARRYTAGTTPEQIAQQWMQGQQALLAPSREQQWANAAQTNFNQGTGGLSVAQGGNLQAANPIAQAIANAQAQQDVQLASQAQQQGQQQYSWGQGLFNTAYNPLTASLNTAQSVENLGQTPYLMSNQIASNVANQANNAAPYQYKATSYDPNASMISGLLGNQQLVSGIGKLFGGNTGTFDAQPDASGATSNQWWL